MTLFETSIYMMQTRPHVGILISLGNALLHLGIIKEPWDQDGHEFQKMVEFVGDISDEARDGKLADLTENWPSLVVYRWTALEVSKEWAVRQLDKGGIISIPLWDERNGLISVLITGHNDGQFFKMVNRHPMSDLSVVSVDAWESMGFRRWNIPVTVYSKRAS